MPHLPLSALMLSVLALTACTDDGDPDAPASDSAEATAPTGSTDPASSGDSAEVTTEDPATDDTEASTSTSAPLSDDAGSTTSPDGSNGQAAADRTEDFMVALVSADPEFCRLLVGAEGDAPMAESPDELRLCEQNVIPRLEGQVSEEEAAVIEVIEIDGATVDGDTARVSAENFGGIFAEGFGDADILLRRFDGQWYVDLQRSDLGSSSP